MTSKSQEQQAKPARPAQAQERQPGREHEMEPRPRVEGPDGGCRRLVGKVALVSGGDSGIGRAVAVAFAREGADVAILYLEEHRDAEETRTLVEGHGRRCVLIAGDVGDKATSAGAVKRTVDELGHLDVLVNDAAEPHERPDLREVSEDELERTFRTNVFGMFFLTQAALDHLPDGGTIVNTASVTAYRGSPSLIPYASTKGAIVAFTRSLSGALASKGIRVNAVAPGPVWTPPIPASFDPEKVKTSGSQVPLERAGEPADIAPCFVFLASTDASYMTGQVLHPNGGEVINA